MCLKPSGNQKYVCDKRPLGFGPKFPTSTRPVYRKATRPVLRKDVEGAKNDAEKKVDQTNKLPVLKF